MPEDFSVLFNKNEARARTEAYTGSICSNCGGLCCAYNTSPISHTFSVSVNLDDESIVNLKKALLLHGDFKKRFENSFRLLMEHFHKKGFGRDIPLTQDSQKFSVETVVQALWKVDREIDQFNQNLYQSDPLNQKGLAYSDCLFLIPGTGCILEEYRPYTCITSFRKCFGALDLNDFVEGNIHQAEEERLLSFLRADLEIDRERFTPVIIIGAGEDFISKVRTVMAEKKTVEIPPLSPYQLTLLADFICLPFLKTPEPLKDFINRDDFYFFGKIKDSPPVTFVRDLTEGPSGDDYGFGMDYVRVFRV